MSRPDDVFMGEMAALEGAYLQSEDLLAGSGFGGGRARWVAERSPLVDAINRDGTFLDVGCANGLLAADVVGWSAERGYRIVPYGIDLGKRLITQAKDRNRTHASNFVVADAWTWMPSRQWTFVYSLLDLSPADLRCEWVRRLYGWVEQGGRLILGSYGSNSRRMTPEPAAEVLNRCGLEAGGRSLGGDGPITLFGWADKP